MCVWTITLQLSISFSMVISHRASPPLDSAIHRSSLGWTPCHFSLQRFSLGFLKAKRGVGEQSLAWPPPPPPLLLPLNSLFSLFFFSLSPSSVKSLRSSPTWADSTILQGSEGFSYFSVLFCFFSFLPSFSRLVPGRHGNKKGKLHQQQEQ